MEALIQTIKAWVERILSLLKFIRNGGDTDNNDGDDSDFPDIKPGFDDVVCYYGCPNSNRVKKLQLEKKLADFNKM